jgi:Tol biopolymer transport system component
MKRLRITLTALAGLALLAPAASASFAGDNGRIYFSTSKQGEGIQPALFSMTPRGKDIEPVAKLPGAQREVAVSPNGAELAFWAYRGTAFYGLWSAGADGSDPAELVATNSNPQPAFTADGETIAYHDLVGETSAEHIYTVPADGSGPGGVPLIDGPGDKHRWPTFSSDGSLMAFTPLDDRPAISTQDWNVYVANADGSDPARVTNFAAAEYAPDFAPDGSQIVFWARDRAGESDIYSVRPDGTGRKRLTPRDGISEWAPDYSPNGRNIVYMRKLGTNTDIFKMNANGSHRRALTHLKRAASQPDWATKPAG